MTVAPAIDGQLTDAAGAPVAGARIAVSTGMADERCDKPAATATTDAEGRYAFSRIRRTQWFVPLYGDWIRFYHVCVGNRPIRSGMVLPGEPRAVPAVIDSSAATTSATPR